MTKTLYFGCMPFRYSEQDIRQLFEPYGQVQSVELHEDLEQARFDAYAHVALDTEDLDRVVRALDGRYVGDQPLQVHELQQRRDERKFLER